MDFIIEKVALHMVYAIGIGLTALVAKIIGKKFLSNKYKKSSWKKFRANSHNNSVREMNVGKMF